MRVVRHTRIRSKVRGTSKMPRLAVYRSNKHLYVQIIDDTIGKTLVAAHDFDIKKGTKRDMSTAVGTLIAERAKAKNIMRVVFDRGGFLYAGRVKALAEAARAGGLQF